MSSYFLQGYDVDSFLGWVDTAVAWTVLVREYFSVGMQ